MRSVSMKRSPSRNKGRFLKVSLEKLIFQRKKVTFDHHPVEGVREVGEVTLEVRSLRRVQEVPAAAEGPVVDVVISRLVLFGVPCPRWDVPQSVHAFITIL